MARFRIALLMTLASLLIVSGAQAAVLHAVSGPDVKPADPDYRYLPQVFDCSAAVDTIALSPDAVDTLRGDTTGGVNQIDSYPCAIWNELGPEHIYRLEVLEDVELTAALRDSLELTDHDLFLLNACDTDSCLVGANTEFTAVLTPGVYYLIIDGARADDEGPYTVALEMRWPGVPPAICDPGGSVPVACTIEAQFFHSNTVERPDQVRIYDCAHTILRGGEVWYAVTVPAEHDLVTDFTIVAPSLDIGLWIFDGCGPDAVCLAHRNFFAAGQPEKLTWKNETGSEALVYLGVDSFSAPTDSVGGDFILQLICDSNVPVEKQSLGSFKSLSR